MDYSLAVHGILQARILEWLAISFSNSALGFKKTKNKNNFPKGKELGRFVPGLGWAPLPQDFY